MKYFFVKSDDNHPKKFPEVEQGDFYVEYGVCTSCGAPQAEAPDLIDHSDKDEGHCYFKKQPKTDEEIERAIKAIAVSCISGLRYRGKDEKILKRLYEVGEEAQCDHKPIGNYKLIVWNTVTFKFDGTIKQLSDTLPNQIMGLPSYVPALIVDFAANNRDSFQFTYRWAEGVNGIIFKCVSGTENIYKIQIEKEGEMNDISIRYKSIMLNSILRNDTRITNISWIDGDGNQYTEGQIK